MPFSTRQTPRLRRASGRVAVALAIALTCVSVGSSAATAVPLPPPSPNPLDPSIFQGGDGNQDDAPSLIDWEALDGAGRVVHNPDPNAEDSAFKKGSEDEPGNWELGVEKGGVNPGKANIVDGWAAVDPVGDDTFVYLAFARRETGESQTVYTFELNHDAQLWDNGASDTPIPCRRTGDVLVSYDPKSPAEVFVQRWTTGNTDPATGCATTGSLTNVTTLTPGVDVQGAINSVGITAHLEGGFYSGTIGAGLFGEAALNFSQILRKALGNPCFAFNSVWVHSRSSDAENSAMQDYVAPHGIVARSCSASGAKFEDRNGNGRRDAGEPGLPRWTIWADYDNDGVRDAEEPFGITDTEGQYVINGIRPPNGTYTLRETLPTRGARRRAAVARVRCSFPNRTTPGGTGNAPGGMFRCGWIVSTATTAYARGRDFGNFRAAELVVRKRLLPSTDPGRFDLFVNGRIVLAAAGDGASRTLALRPGTYDISEAASPGTNAADYRSNVQCKLGTRRAQSRSGTSYENLQLAQGQRAVCTFRNLRPGTPAIAIDKTGPASAEAGDTLRYTLFVTNPGDVPFPEASVRVTDPNCDAAPVLTGKGGDTSPGTLDPGDTWTYSCSRRTSETIGCPALIPNTASVTGTAQGTTVADHITIETTLQCPPPEPGPGPGPGPGPQPPGPEPPPSPLVPPGPGPPDSGDAAHAGFILRQATAGCIRTRVPRVSFQGTRIARIQVYVNGRLRRRLTVQSLQRRLTPRVQLAPGRYRLSVRVTFDRGTGTPPVTLARRIRICGVLAARPPFTG